jgi:hypothetical protein
MTTKKETKPRKATTKSSAKAKVLPLEPVAPPPPVVETPAPKPEAPARKLSALDAAAQVLAATCKPMSSLDLIEAMADQGLWISPSGKTPANTLYAAIAREITVKKDESRFAKSGRGQFVHA